MIYDQRRVAPSDTAGTRWHIRARRSLGRSDQTLVTAFVVRPQVRAEGFLDQLRQRCLALQRRDASAQLERRVDVKGDAAGSAAGGPSHAVSLALFPGIRDLRKPAFSLRCLVHVYPGIMIVRGLVMAIIHHLLWKLRTEGSK